MNRSNFYITGTLTVKPLKAEIQDSVFSANSNPKLFCQVKFGSKTQSTLPVRQTQKRFSWSEELKFRRNNERVITIEIYHRNFFINPDLIGEGKYRFIRNLQNSCFILTCNILQNEEVIGKIELELEWEPDISENDFVQFASSRYGSSEIVLEQPERLNFEDLVNSDSDDEGMKKFKEQEIQTEKIQIINDLDMDDHDKCVTCYETKKLVAFYKCGHICCCQNCALKLVNKRCPCCRERVNEFIKVYRVS